MVEEGVLLLEVFIVVGGEGFLRVDAFLDLEEVRVVRVVIFLLFFDKKLDFPVYFAQFVHLLLVYQELVFGLYKLLRGFLAKLLEDDEVVVNQLRYLIYAHGRVKVHFL